MQHLRVALIWATPALVALAASLAGRFGALRRWPRAALATPALILALVVAVLVALGHDPDVPAGDVVAGALIAGGATGAVLLAYAVAGRLFADAPPILAFVFVLTLVPLYIATAVVGLIVLGYTECPPDAYECPL